MTSSSPRSSRYRFEWIQFSIENNHQPSPSSSSASLSVFDILEGFTLGESEKFVPLLTQKIENYSSRICDLDDILEKLKSEVNDHRTLKQEWQEFLQDEIMIWHHLQKRLKREFSHLIISDALASVLDTIDLSLLTLSTRKEMPRLLSTNHESIVNPSQFTIQNKRLELYRDLLNSSQGFQLENRSFAHLSAILNEPFASLNNIEENDMYGFNPVEISWIYGSISSFQSILNQLNNSSDKRQKFTLGNTALAIGLSRHGLDRYIAVLSFLAQHSTQIIDNLLVIACRQGLVDAVQELLPLISKIPGLGLIESAKNGHADCIKKLLDAQVDLSFEDDRHWTAFQYAVFYGQTKAIHVLLPYKNGESRQQKALSLPITPPKVDSKRKHILFHLGSRCHPDVEAVHLFQEGQELSNYILSIQDNTINFSEHLWTLPLVDEKNQPRSFSFDYDSNAHSALQVSLIHKYDKLVVATTNVSIEQYGFHSVWMEKSKSGGRAPINLMREGKPFAMVVLEYFVVKPFMDETDNKKTIWDSNQTKLIGHRGLGMNKPFVNNKCKLQLGENTIMSFQEASKSGASFVEFDIQLTSDEVPIIYHDWTVPESGYNLPVHSLTVNEFKSVHDQAHPAVGSIYKNAITKLKGFKTFDDNVIMKHHLKSNDYARVPKWPWKGNGDGTVQSEFVTLQEMFEKLDPNLGFNVEIKYPFEFEAEQNQLNVIDLNTYVDKILSIIFKYAKSRKIVISSFHPECVIAARCKQDTYPVFFLTEAGAFQSPDNRCNSYDQALKLCLTFNLAGIVTDVQPLLYSPFEIIRTFHKNNLAILSYGGGNNSRDNVLLEIQCGMDAIIADDVRYLSDLFKK